jgi:PTH1 family peptidyl-tRNA hydrolase
MIRLIVGLGNPGPEYEHTRHNAGFWWVDAAARQLGTTLQFDRNYHGLVARVNRPEQAGGPLWLLQPMTFMNLSGKAAGPLARFFKIEPPEILVIHDELDLPPGQMKLKQGGGAAGHNGLKDLLAHLGGPDFWRLRIGIGHPGDRTEVANWVLRKPPLDDRLAMDKCIAKSLAALPLLLDGEMERAMMKIHAKPQRPKPPRPTELPADAAPASAPVEPTAVGAAPPDDPRATE